jgi:hypothetical protein
LENDFREILFLKPVGHVFFSLLLILTTNFHITVENPLLAAIFAGVISGCGSGLIFRSGRSGGGTGIIAMILNRRLSVRVGIVSTIINSVPLVLGALLINLDAALYSIIYVFISGSVLDRILAIVSLWRTKQRSEFPFKVLFHRFAIPQVFRPKGSLLVNEHVAREGDHAVAFADDSVFVQQNRQADSQVIQKLLNPLCFGRRILGMNREDLESLASQLPLQPLQVLEVLFAWLAPGREKGKDNGLLSLLLPVFLQGNSLPFQSGSDEPGSFFPYLSLSGSRRQEEKTQKEKEKCSGSFVSQYGIHGVYFTGSREGDQHPFGAAHLQLNDSFFCSKASLWPGSKGVARKKQRWEKNSARRSCRASAEWGGPLGRPVTRFA